MVGQQIQSTGPSTATLEYLYRTVRKIHLSFADCSGDPSRCVYRAQSARNENVLQCPFRLDVFQIVVIVHQALGSVELWVSIDHQHLFPVLMSKRISDVDSERRLSDAALHINERNYLHDNFPRKPNHILGGVPAVRHPRGKRCRPREYLSEISLKKTHKTCVM